MKNGIASSVNALQRAEEPLRERDERVLGEQQHRQDATTSPSAIAIGTRRNNSTNSATTQEPRRVIATSPASARGQQLGRAAWTSRDAEQPNAIGMKPVSSQRGSGMSRAFVAERRSAFDELRRCRRSSARSTRAQQTSATAANTRAPPRREPARHEVDGDVRLACERRTTCRSARATRTCTSSLERPDEAGAEARSAARPARTVSSVIERRARRS